MDATLVVLGGIEPVRYKLEPGKRFTVGRHRSNALVVQDEHCSRHHAEILQEAGHWILRDLNSQNGSYVEGRRIEHTVLENGQELRFGSLRLRFQLPPVDGESPPPADGSPLESTPRPDSALALLDRTNFQADQLTALCRFMAETVHEPDAQTMVRRALELVLGGVQADMVGFLGLDETGRIVPTIMLPAGSEFDQHLSRRLTDEVQKQRRTIWLSAEREDVSSDSLVSFEDAICIPMPGTHSWLGAMHVYRRQQAFTPQDPKFCEVVARHLADSLRLLQIRRQLQSENARLRQHGPLAERIIGSSPVIQQLVRDIDKVAVPNTTVLIRGESGVGKELVAQALHQRSPRADGPLEVVNCAAIPSELVESHLFGHKKGAFTSAVSERTGCFVKADGGTLFLDEIGELPLNVQAKLLRVLEDGLVQPLGSDEVIRVNLRILAATNRDLQAVVEKNQFRKDLLFRLHFEIFVPPLRQHLEDIPELVDYYLKYLETKCGRRCRLTPQAINRLKRHHWPGNVRELVGVLESAVILSDNAVIDVGDLRVRGEGRQQTLPTLNIDELERLAYEEALRQTQSQAKDAMALLGVKRGTFYNRLQQYELHCEE